VPFADNVPKSPAQVTRVKHPEWVDTGTSREDAKRRSDVWLRDTNRRYLAFGIVALVVMGVLTIAVGEWLGTGFVFWTVVAVVIAAAWLGHDRFVHRRGRSVD